MIILNDICKALCIKYQQLLLTKLFNEILLILYKAQIWTTFMCGTTTQNYLKSLFHKINID